MKRGSLGHFETTAVAGETVEAFVPDPLPPKKEIVFDQARRRLLERATLALGRLDSATLLLPDSDIFLYSYIRLTSALGHPAPSSGWVTIR